MMQQRGNKKLLILGIISGVIVITMLTVMIMASGDTKEIGGGSNEAEDRGFDEAVEAYLEEHPIIINLPIVEKDYRIDYGDCMQTVDEFCIIISSKSDEARRRAETELMGLDGYSSGDTIEYYSLDE